MTLPREISLNQTLKTKNLWDSYPNKLFRLYRHKLLKKQNDKSKRKINEDTY